MDWNKTKTIFIVVFAILNVFLYSLYLNRHTEAQNLQFVWETTIEESLQLDNIKYKQLPTHNEESFYITAETAKFTDSQLDKFDNQEFKVIDETYLLSTLNDPLSVESRKVDLDFKQFLIGNVINGKDYILWEVDEEKKQAVFFQKINGKPIYFNENAMLIAYWNKDGKITNYEQRMFGEFVSYNKKKDLLAPIQAINTLYLRSYLKPDSKITSMTLGYSTLIQVTKNQVFAPTWHVHVELKDGKKQEYFINAIEGKIIEFQSDIIAEDNE